MFQMELYTTDASHLPKHYGVLTYLRLQGTLHCTAFITCQIIYIVFIISISIDGSGILQFLVVSSK